MPLTAGQTTAFFEHADQMGIPNATVVQLKQEGIDNVDSLADFHKTTIEQTAVLTFDALLEGYPILIQEQGQALRFRHHLLYLEPSPR